MTNRSIEIFYLFLQGILVFQVLIFSILCLVTRRKDILFYNLFLVFAALYFFINAPYTFFNIPEQVVWDSLWYDYVNTPVIIAENLFYLLFLKAFFSGISNDRIVKNTFRVTLWLIPLLFLLFVTLTVLRVNKQFIFYLVNFLTTIPSLIIVFRIFEKKLPYASLVGAGLICSIAGTLITMSMITLGNYFGVHNLFTDSYPLFFIRLGVLFDMIFYFMAILAKWHVQEKQFAVERLQSQLAVEKFRNKISSELHDDIGSTLSGINMYSHLLGEALQDQKIKEAKNAAAIIHNAASEITHKLGDLVLTVKPGTASLLQLLNRLRDYAAEMAAAKQIHFIASVPEGLYRYNLPVDTRHNIYLFCKEAINNAVKHSECSSLELLVREINDTLELSIADNGKGFNEATIQKGNGLANMKKRGQEIGAAVGLETEHRMGSKLFLLVKT